MFKENLTISEETFMYIGEVENFEELKKLQVAFTNQNLYAKVVEPLVLCRLFTDGWWVVDGGEKVRKVE